MGGAQVRQLPLVMVDETVLQGERAVADP